MRKQLGKGAAAVPGFRLILRQKGNKQKYTVKSDKTNPDPTLQIGLFSGDAADLYWAREPAAEGGSPWARGWLGAMAIPIGFGTLP